MPSPFPGMNPYLEQAGCWQDFHNTFLIAIREALTAQLQPRYFVRVEEHVYIHEYDSADRRPLGRPDVSIFETGQPRTSSSGIASAVASPTSVLIPPQADELHTSYLEIRDRAKRQVVTAIELLSPSNKYPGADREVYWNKARRLLASPTHFVEIDLLRGGPRMPWLELPPCSYYALVSRHERRPKADIWPVGIRDALPIIPVPVKAEDPEPQIDLQAMLHRVYDAAGYHWSIYDGEPEPPLEADDREWADRLLAASRDSA